MTLWEVVSLRMHDVAVCLIKLSCFKLERVQPRESAPPLSPQFLGSFQELVSKALAAQTVGNPQNAYLEPIPDRVADYPTNRVAFRITENDAKLAIIARFSELIREFDQFLLNVVGFALRHVVVNAVFHMAKLTVSATRSMAPARGGSSLLSRDASQIYA